jgi:glycosyltransferase involved in cell wall biosynthesis
MRIAHVNVAKNYRGGERQTELLIRELARQGIEQRLVARRDGVLAERLADMDIDIRRVSGHLPGVIRSTHGVDIVHVHEGRSIYAAWLRHALSGTPYIATRRVNNPIRDHRIAHHAYRSAACVVGVAPQVADIVSAFDPGIATNVILSSSSGLVPEAEQVQAIRRRFAGKFIVGHVGALDMRQKAQDVIIEAARVLHESHPEIHFLLVGGGSDSGVLHELAAGLDNLSFTGFVENVGDYLAAFDIFVLPSRKEGIGSILFDAMNQGLPLIATPVGGVPSIVHEGENGLLIDVDSADQLAAAILKLASDQPLRDQLGENGRQMSIGSTPSQMAASYLDLYRYVLESD